MPDLGKGDSQGVLTRYYNDGLEGAEQWNQIASLKLKDETKLKDGIMRAEYLSKETRSYKDDYP